MHQTHNFFVSYFSPILLFLLSISQSSTAPINPSPNNGYQITDLTYNDLTTFAFQTETWSISGLAGSSNSSLCGANFPILGGYNIFSTSETIENIYSSLPTHSALYFQIDFALIDAFQSSDSLTLTLSGTSIDGGSNLQVYNSYLTSDICGGSDPDTTQFTIMGSIPHSLSTLDLKIVAQTTTGTFGIRDISLIFANDSSVTSTTSCFRVFDTQLISLPGECQCQKGYYYDSLTCSLCDPSCGDCFGPSSSQCYSCVSGYSWTGSSCIQCDSSCVSCSGPNNNQCLTCQPGSWLQKNGTCTPSCNLPTSASQVVGFLQVCETICPDGVYFWNGSCVSSCPLPLVDSIIDGNLICLQPCQTGEFLNYDGSCVSSCPSPYIQATNNSVPVCNFPCNSLSDYLFPNGSCNATCNSSLISSVSGNVNLCTSPCGTDWMYEDYIGGQCNPQCNSPLLASVIMGINYCNSPCGLAGYINPNGSCRAQCDPPLVAATYNAINWCSSPCGYYDYYYTNNNTCQTTCPSPGVIVNYDLVNVCSGMPNVTSATSTTSLTTAQKNAVNQASSVISGAGTTARAGTAASSIVSSGSPNAISLIALMKMLDYIRYMKINYPPKLEYFLDGQEGSISLNIQVNLPEKVQEGFPDYPLPGKFGDYDLKSSFIINYWEELFTCIIIFIILAFATVLAFYTKKIKYIGVFFVKVQNVIQWNLMLIVICSNIDSVGVYSSLEFRTTPFNSFLSVLGTLICGLVNLVAVFLMGLTLFITYSLWRARKSVCPIPSHGLILQISKKETQEKYLNCGVLYLNFRETSFLQSSCMFFILLRIYLFNMVIGYLFDHPLAQAILIFLMSFLMLLYLCFQRPYKKSYDLIKEVTYESIIFIVNICILILAVIDHKGVHMIQERARLGDTIIFANVFFNVVAVLFFGIDVMIRLVKAYRISKKVKTRGLKFWTEILVALFQPEDLEDVAEEQAKKKHGIKKETIIIKNLDLGSGDETHLDLEKSSQLCLKHAKASITVSTPHEQANSILSFEGLGDNGSTKNFLLSPQNAMRKSSIEQDSSVHNPEKRRISRQSLLNRFSVLNQTNPSVTEVDSVKLSSKEASSTRTPKHSLLKEEKETLKLKEDVFLKDGSSVFRNRRKIRICSPTHSSDDNLEKSSF